jgi:energy-coupling factor transporter ATP-binding protein EcfA2
LSSETRSLIEVRGVGYRYEGGPPVLHEVDLDIGSAEFISIVGANGSGKTTLVKHFNGLLRPGRGSVRVAGMDTRRCSVARLSRTVGFVFQNPDHQIFAYSLWDEVVFGLKNLGIPKGEIELRATEALQAVGLYGIRLRHPRTLSRGQRQRLATASVLAIGTEVLVLDEPTTGQDYLGRRQLMSLASELHGSGRTIVMVTHDMALVAEYSTRVIVMKQGHVVLDGSPRQAFGRGDVLASTGLRLPPLMEVARRLSGMVDVEDATTVERLAGRLMAGQRSTGPLPAVRGAEVGGDDARD